MKSIINRALRMPWNRSTISVRFLWSLSIFSLLIFSSCEKETYHGQDGRPGRAYLSLTWIDAKPLYLEAGTYDIPRVFEWGRYYLTYPGRYQLYYEGEIWNGHGYSFYAWEMDYEIWINYGEPGGYGYDGRDGRDTYFTLELSPFGPYYYSNDNYKNGSTNEVIVETTDNELITVTKASDEYTLKITFKKLDEKRMRSEELVKKANTSSDNTIY